MKFLSLFFFMFFMLASSVFSQAYDGNIEYDKKDQKAIQIDFAYPQEAVQNAIIQKMEKLGNRGREEKGLFNRDKGFIVFRGSVIPDVSETRMDYIIKVDRKSRRDSDESTLSMIINKDGNNALSGMDTYGVTKAKSFLNRLLPDIEEANLELEIKAQEEALSKAEKKYKNLQDDQQSLEKKIKGLQSDLEKNIKDQEDQQKEIESQTKTLEDLKSKRKGAQL